MIQEMTSSLESAELRYNRSHAAPFQSHGAPPKIMPQSDISFHNTANCESIDLLTWQSNSGLGSRQKNLTTSIPTREQNRRQKVFNRGDLHFCGGALGLCGGEGRDTQKINKNSTDL